jgi:3-phosphoinositide dependent protein kinase-1
MKYVVTERNLLAMTNHPGIIKIAFSFQDEQRLYLILELAPNGMLLDYIHGRCIDLEAVRHYMAEIVLALEHLHSKAIVHRDLKPENLLLDEKMHIKITDFGTAKWLKGPPPTSPSGAPLERKNSFPGSEEYVSPELLGEDEVTEASDLWALGVILYQLLVGKMPFKGATQFLTFQLIEAGEVAYPEGIDAQGKDLIAKLLVKDPSKRLGAGEGGYDKLKAHPFFEGINWEWILTSKPPELPPRQKLD